MATGRSHRTPYKHWLLNALLGKINGALSTRKCFAKPPLHCVDLCAGDGKVTDEHQASPIIFQKHARHKFGRANRMTVDLIEKDQNTYISLAYRDAVAADADKRMKSGVNPPPTLAEGCGETREILGKRFGIGKMAIDKAAVIALHAPELGKEVHAGFMQLEPAYRVAAENKRSSELHPAPADEHKTSATVADDAVADDEVDEEASVDEYEDYEELEGESVLEEEQEVAVVKNKPSEPDNPTVVAITVDGRETKLDAPKKVVFNKTNDSVDWASWTWNPVTGCNHGCSFCYAREIANSERMKPYYPNGFEPTFHDYRLVAPENTSLPTSDNERGGRVFVCSMADLFGKWVPDEWIKAVFHACLKSPHWEYIFLTKWPERYSKMPLIKNAWYGASVIKQADVKRVESSMKRFPSKDVVKWISLEPMLEPIQFTDLSWCDLVVIGSQTSTNQPEGFVPAFSPKFDWVVDVVNQCREANVPYYLKANLGAESPGMELPKMRPRK